MRQKLFVLLPAILLLSILIPYPALADGIIIPEPPPCDPCPIPSPMSQLVIRYHRVSVEIENQIAVTRIDQVFYNPNDWEVEGMYVFPMPQGAGVGDFNLWIDGEPIQGEIMEADQARAKYEAIVRSLRDPALLEYAGQDAYQAHIFPIPAKGEQRIELEYSQVLNLDQGLVRYIYPLNTEKFSAQPLENVSVHIHIRSKEAIRAVYSPDYSVDVEREGDYEVRVGYEEQNVLPDSDFNLYYSLGETEAIHLLSTNENNSPSEDGTFLLLLAPPLDVPEAVAKDVILVLDRSGSMEGDKFKQAQEAVSYILQHLNPEDRFNLIAFSTSVDAFAPGLRSTSEASEALNWVDRLNAQGSTDINRALLEAVTSVNPEKPTYLIFLTDGLPTEGVTSSEQIIKNLADAAPASLRLYPFGVGFDVDTYLLDWLAQSHHGLSTYVLPNERLDETLSDFYARISAPVMTDLVLDFGKIAVYDLYPSPLPDLFQGTQIVLLGRYKIGGDTDITLTGNINGQVREIKFPNQKFDIGELTTISHNTTRLSTIPRLWATRKIGHLLQQIRLEGPNQETINQIVQLSIRYGIVTPYTSYLVTEPMPLGEAQQERIAEQLSEQMDTMSAAPSYGQAAVENATIQKSLAGAQEATSPEPATREQVRYVGERTFVQVSDKWIDTAFDPELMQPTEIVFLSPEYFKLIEENTFLATAFALGPQVIALSDGIAYEVVIADIYPESVSDQIEDVTPTPAVNLPMINKAGTPAPTQAAPEDLGVSPPLPCVGGILLMIALPLSLMMHLRNRIRDRVY